MPLPKGKVAGLRERISCRVGLDVRQFRGMNRDDDAGMIGHDQFWLLENTRLDGGAIRARPGLAKVFGSGLGGCVYGVWDDRNPTVPTTPDLVLAWYNGATTSPSLWDGTTYTPGTGVAVSPVVIPALSKLYYLRTYNANFIIYMDPLDTTTVLSTGEPGLLFGSGETLSSRAGIEFGGKMYFATTSGSNVKIYSFDGETTTTDATFASAGQVVFATDGTELYCVEDNGSNALRVRKRSGGSWTVISTLPTVATGWETLSGVTFDTKAYFYVSRVGTGLNAYLYSATASTVTLEATIAHSFPELSPNAAYSAVIFNGSLYFFQTAIDGIPRLYEWDGATVTERFDFADVGAVVDITGGQGLLEFNGSLHAFIVTETSHALVKSSGSTVTSWSVATALDLEDYPWNRRPWAFDNSEYVAP